jgi:lipoprotein-anchoring transpeptidase ErfK/SrfK
VAAVAALATVGCAALNDPIEASSASTQQPAQTTAQQPTTAAPTTTSTTSPPAPTTTSTTAPPPPADAEADDGVLRPGEAGPAVLALQGRLAELGYWLGEPDGDYGRLTEQAVVAFQKAEGLSADGVAGPATLAALDAAARPTPRSPAAGIEIDLARQLLLVVADGEVRWALNTSTGTDGWDTPPGTFRIEREIDGVRHAPLGDLYRPKYFNGGIAVHGASEVPAHRASHGCARVTNAAMDFLWSSGLASVGTEVRVY